MDPNCWFIFVLLTTICVCSISAEDTSTFYHRLEATEDLVKALSNRVDLLESREKIHHDRITELEASKELVKALSNRVDLLESREKIHLDRITELEATEELVKALSNRVDLLESHEKVHLDRITELESRDSRQQETIDKLQKQLEEHLTHSQHLNEALANNRTYHDESKPMLQNISEGISQTKKRDAVVQRIRQAAFESPIAFFALIGSTVDNAGVSQTIVFDNVVTNIGNAYIPSIGTFIAPMEGVYVFSTTLVAHGFANGHASFYRNTDIINVMYINGAENGWVTSSTVTLHLMKGDTVTVRNGDSNGAYYGAKHSCLSGFLLSSNVNDQSVIVGR